jgi:ParB family chromosome partitioning protein
MFAGIVGRSLNFQVFHPDAKLLQAKDVGALCNEIDGATLNKALVKSFADNASDYFSSVNKTLCLEAITEALGADAAKPLASKPKSVAADFAVAHVVKTGWLPEMMRSHGYEAPKPTKKAAKAAKVTRRVPAKRSKIVKRKGR